ncbi:MAG: pyridoxamine 5'-phosphate oxidase family protein [Peptococcaceae bacterium]|nr:pyridoxamine 5'-phosphate oxidase family protein [Peptococcaceae bacterium]
MKIASGNWNKITSLYNEYLKKASYCSFATTSSKNEPNVTPIGSLVLRDDFSGFFFDIFPTAMAENLEDNGQICLLLVNTSKLFWFQSFRKGVFKKPCGIKLAGTVGKKRKATPEEKEAFLGKLKIFKRFKGFQILWGDLTYVRDVTFTDYYPINTGAMTPTAF